MWIWLEHFKIVKFALQNRVKKWDIGQDGEGLEGVGNKNNVGLVQILRLTFKKMG